MPEVTDEERAGDVVAFAVRHEERIKLADELVLDVLEAARDVVLRDDHAVQHLNSILSQLIMVAEAKVDDVTD